MILRAMIPLALTSALLGGCVTVFPEAEPSSLYKLAIAEQAAAQPTATTKLNLLRSPTAFPRVSAGDQIMTVSGTEAAAIAGARWAAPVQIMFDEQLSAAFDPSPKVRLLTRGGAAAPDATLRVEVRTFEARYSEPAQIAPGASSKAKAKDFDKRGAPTVIIEIKGTVNYPSNSAVVVERHFRAEVPASENRVGAIVAAYDGATTQVMRDLVGWVESLPAPPRPAQPTVSQR